MGGMCVRFGPGRGSGLRSGQIQTDCREGYEKWISRIEVFQRDRQRSEITGSGNGERQAWRERGRLWVWCGDGEPWKDQDDRYSKHCCLETEMIVIINSQSVTVGTRVGRQLLLL